MDRFSCRPDIERRTIFQEAANRRGLTSIIIEKDFWVCWTLKRLYENPVLAPYLTFKGGTSLSKAYGLIERFSEDIDITISRDAPFINEGLNPMEVAISGKELKRRLDNLKQNAQRFVEKVVIPNLKTSIQNTLGYSEGWDVVVDEHDSSKQTLLFHYPKVLDYISSLSLPVTFGYIKPQIKLEFGARGEPEPNGNKTIQPYVAEVFPQLFIDSKVNIQTLAAERSFWEKITILHSLYHGARQGDRMSRHYYDTFMMAEKGLANSALKQVSLLEQVVRNKSVLFKDTKASYESAHIGSLRLVPHTELLTIIKKDYQAMDEMFMGDVPSFDNIMAKLESLEHSINQYK